MTRIPIRNGEPLTLEEMQVRQGEMEDQLNMATGEIQAKEAELLRLRQWPERVLGVLRMMMREYELRDERAAALVILGAIGRVKRGVSDADPT